MAKNWQYGRLRTVALQVAMWLVLGASLGLAAFIDHRRSGSLDVTLGEPVAEGRLVVRLPKGWEVDVQESKAGPPRTLTVIDFDRQGRRRRTLRITQEQQSGRPRGPEYYIESAVNLPIDDEGGALQTEPFPFLGQDDAVLLPLKINMRALRRYVPTASLPEAGLYACAVTPDGLAVLVQVTGDGAYGPSNRALLRRVADNIRLSDSTSATRPKP